MLSSVVNPLSSLNKIIDELGKKALDDKKTKACLFNLVIDVEKKERLNYYQKVINELIDYFPCRIFLIHFDAQLKTPDVKVSLKSPKSAPNLVCDFIEINLSPEQSPLLPSLIFANMVTDLPFYYLPAEHGDHLSDFTYTMASIAKRVICDSTDVADIDAFLENMARLTKEGIDVADLNWSRIESWREMIANNLNSDLLNKLQLVQIIYNHNDHHLKQYPFQAILLKAFLSLRFLENFKKPLKIELVAKTESSIWPGAILEVNFSDNHQTKQVFLRNLENPQEAIIHFESPSECHIPLYTQFTKTESGQSLIKEFRHTGVSTDYMLILKNLKKYL